ncbi:MAG TPA: hypothetical protein VGN69_06280 [Solirubrobacteraceae bacterium]|jgi:O-antigen ligase|nr:hypothetical protein [Solirubrobacteraceae bacterium]
MSWTDRARRGLSFDRLRWGSFAHSLVYLALLAVAVLVHAGGVAGLGGALFVLGMAHGIGWIVMTLLAIAALRLGVISLRLAVAIAIVGAVGPFVGSVEFVREGRRRRA